MEQSAWPLKMTLEPSLVRARSVCVATSTTCRLAANECDELAVGTERIKFLAARSLREADKFEVLKRAVIEIALLLEDDGRSLGVHALDGVAAETARPGRRHHPRSCLGCD